MRKTFAKVLSITLTLMLILGTIMMPVSAAAPETGLSVGNVQIYTATDARAETEAWVTGQDSTWKFAVSGLNDTFKVSSADFAAPIAEAKENGKIKLSWTAPEGAEGKATVKVIGSGYNKEVVVTGNTVTLGDTELNNTYSAQITIGDVSSQILNYNNIYSPIKSDVLGSDDESILIERNNSQQWAWTRFYVGDHTDYVGDNAGIIFKVDSEFIEENIFNVTHFENKNTSAYEELPYKDADGNVIQDIIPSTEVGIAMEMYIGGQNAVDGVSGVQQFTGDENPERTVLRIDTTGKESREIKKTDTYTPTLISSAANMKNNFYEGYFIVPFDVIGEEGIEFIKNYGALSLTTSRYRYFTSNTLNTTGRWTSNNAVKYEYTDMETELTDDIKRISDRELYIKEAGFISNIDAFIDTCADTESDIAGVTVGNLGASAENKKVYLDTATLVSGTKYTLSNETAVSTYTVDKNDIQYTSAAGEKMSLGFTAPQAGYYEVSAPITADVAGGVHYRLVKEDANGSKITIQNEKTYAGEVRFILDNISLETGETIWFEAWADTANTAIDIGVPVCIRLNKVYNSSTKTVTYTSGNYAKAYSNAYENNNTVNLFDIAPTWEFGTFENPFTIGDTEYDVANNSVKCAADTAGIIIQHDGFGIASMAAVNDETTELDETDGSELYEALTPYYNHRPTSENHTYYNSYNNCVGSTGQFVGASATIGTNGGNGVLDVIGSTNITFGAVIGFGRSRAGAANNDTTTSTTDGKSIGRWSNTGIYQKFTAPADGTAVLSIADGTLLSGKLVVLHNSTVVATLTESAEATDAETGETIAAVNATDLAVTVENVKEGDTISFCVSKIIAATEGNPIDKTSGSYIRPQVEFTTDTTAVAESAVTFDSEIPSIMSEKYENGSVIILPTTAKNGAIFQGWKDAEGNLYAAGTEYTVNADVAFAAEYIYYGDLDADGVLAQGADLSILRKMIVKAEEIEGAVNAELTGDIDADGVIDLIDLIKMKKMSAGMDVTVGAK